jgi:hypothetical protein
VGSVLDTLFMINSLIFGQKLIPVGEDLLGPDSIFRKPPSVSGFDPAKVYRGELVEAGAAGYETVNKDMLENEIVDALQVIRNAKRSKKRRFVMVVDDGEFESLGEGSIARGELRFEHKGVSDAARASSIGL